MRRIGYTDECEHLELHTLSGSFRMWNESLWLIAPLIWETSSESEHREMCRPDEQSRGCTQTCWTPGNFRKPKQVLFFRGWEKPLARNYSALCCKISHGEDIFIYVCPQFVCPIAMIKTHIYYSPDEILYRSLSETKHQLVGCPKCHNVAVKPSLRFMPVHSHLMWHDYI